MIFPFIRKSIYFLLSCFLVLLFSSLSFADISGVEIAMLKQDFLEVKILSNAMLKSSVDKDIKNLIKYYLGVSHIRLKEYDRAESVFKELINQNLSNELKDKVYIALFDIKYMQCQYEQALSTINKLLRISPRSDYLSLIYLKAARVNLKLAKWESSKEYLTKIASVFPKSFEYYSAKQLLTEQHYFAVQVGSFHDRSRAEALAEDVNSKKEYAYIVEASDRSNKKLYRVRVGKLSVLSDAQELKIKLEGEGYPTEIFP